MIIQGQGLGLRRELMEEMSQLDPDIDFIELVPENHLGIGGARRHQLASVIQHYPVLAHGLSLSIGSPAPLDFDFLKQLKDFLDCHQVAIYSEHLSYASDEGHLYDLLPIPFSEEAVRYVSQRIRQVQDILERRVAFENISYYADFGIDLSEREFICAVLAEADCDLLLDVNNVFVNSINHVYDPKEFIDGIPSDRIAYLHIAGHEICQEDLIIDTHGAAVSDQVWALLDYTYQRHGVKATLLERDSEIPPFKTLLKELHRIQALQKAYLTEVCYE